MASQSKVWSKPQLFLCRSPRSLTVLSHLVLHWGSAMEETPEIFIDDTAGSDFVNKNNIVHLYLAAEGWKATKTTMSQNLEGQLWWGVLLQSHKEPWIADLRRYRCKLNDHNVIEESNCTQEDLKKWYGDSELERAEMLGENTRKDTFYKFIDSTLKLT